MGPFVEDSTGASLFGESSIDSGVPSSVFKNGNPLLLDDMPDSSIMSWEMVNLADASPEALSMLRDGFSDASTLSLGSAGIGTIFRPLRYWPVTDSGTWATSSNVPVATTCPPCSPAPGPTSMT